MLFDTPYAPADQQKSGFFFYLQLHQACRFSAFPAVSPSAHAQTLKFQQLLQPT
jgi:hypothetical protein